MTQPTVYVLPGSPSWHASVTCQAVDTASLRGGTITATTDPGNRPACLVCADTGHTDWTLTPQNLWELWELVGPSKPYTEWDQAADRPVVVGLTIREHRGLPRLVARYGDTIRHRYGRYTVHPATEDAR